MTKINGIDKAFLNDALKDLLAIPSPTGMTDDIVGYICGHLSKLGIPYELTRRGAVRGDLKGVKSSPDRAVVSHLDTLGAMVKGFYENGRLQVVPIGSWSARFAEGARVTVYTDLKKIRGTLLPLKASGHTYNEEIDTQPIDWTNLELRLDEKIASEAEARAAGLNVGDIIAIDPAPEFTGNGFICSRHLDDKAGVAAVLTAAKAIVDSETILPIDCYLLFTISEEVGVGASHVLHGDVAELVSIDNGTIAPQQYTSEYGVTVAMQDSSGPFDRQLTRSLIHLCDDHDIIYSRDVFRYYRSDAASAVEAGNDIRTALLCFALDSSHGYERTHIDSLAALSELLVHYVMSNPLFHRDEEALGSVGDLPIVNREPKNQG
ncbi:MAG: osmoprotectant NAGGN system M42 family peptidase [Sneathiella sp.]|nr:osmoprotectant NAGGN system M42 family peptidase [Sneathiella sp.]